MGVRGRWGGVGGEEGAEGAGERGRQRNWGGGVITVGEVPGQPREGGRAGPRLLRRRIAGIVMPRNGLAGEGVGRTT